MKNAGGSPIRIFKDLNGDPRNNLKTINSGDYFSFLFVRNPFDRLLSAYRDRILDHYDSLQANLVVPNILKEEGIRNKITRYLKRAPKSKKNIKFVKNLTSHDLPTFSQFLKHVAKHGHKEANEHWNSYTRTCKPCIANYTFIGHLETSQQDQEFILKESDLGNYTKEVVMQHETKGGPSINWREKYFSQVRCSILRDIYEMYKLDFELFGYDPNEHLQFCKKNKVN